jgi:hypothetical protein
MIEKYHDKAIRLVFDYVKKNIYLPKGFAGEFTIDDVTVVWFCKTLQNWKALVITHTPDPFFYEVTYSGDKQEAYIDTYEKVDNVCIKDKPEITINVYDGPVEDTNYNLRKAYSRMQNRAA